MSALALGLLAVARAADTTLLLEGEVPADGLDHFRIPFEVPAGTKELEVRHDDLSELDILDWGLDDPDGWRGWGGGNTEPAIVGERAASRSYVPGPLPAGTWSVVVGKAKIVEPPGRYAVEVVLRQAPTLPPQDREPWVDPGPLRSGPGWFAGDLHVHSDESGDASATLEEIARLAEERGLDFVVVTDHNTVTQAELLNAVQRAHPDLLLVPGTEFTTYAGHAGALGATAWVDHKIGQPGVTIEAAAEAYAAQGAVVSMNHPLLDLGDACIGCAWEHELPVGAFAALEVGTGGWSPVGQLFTPDVLRWWESLTDEGHRLAAVGGSDDHRAGTDTGPFASPIGSPTTLVYADELSVTGVLDAIRAGRTAVKLQDPADPMAELTAAGGEASVRVTGGAGGQLAWVIDGEEVGRDEVGADDVTLRRPLDPGSRARVEVWRDGHPTTVTSHVWGAGSDEVPVEPAGCGCGAGARGGWALALVALGLARRRGRIGPWNAPTSARASR